MAVRTSVGHDFGNWSFHADFAILTPGMTEFRITRSSFCVTYNLSPRPSAAREKSVDHFRSSAKNEINDQYVAITFRDPLGSRQRNQ